MTWNFFQINIIQLYRYFQTLYYSSIFSFFELTVSAWWLHENCGACTSRIEIACFLSIILEAYENFCWHSEFNNPFNRVEYYYSPVHGVANLFNFDSFHFISNIDFENSLPHSINAFHFIWPSGERILLLFIKVKKHSVHLIDKN